mmetsp:Transcript_35785/g.100727  ORF Transcript_35785/g.100727 Transcript_35785/m.100727 type:complete len:87 (+) Transcript_35785:230-490(+)
MVLVDDVLDLWGLVQLRWETADKAEEDIRTRLCLCLLAGLFVANFIASWCTRPQTALAVVEGFVYDCMEDEHATRRGGCLLHGPAS